MVDAVSMTEKPNRPVKFTDPRVHGLPENSFKRHYVECTVLDGITRREYCTTDACSDYGGTDCSIGELAERTSSAPKTPTAPTAIQEHLAEPREFSEEEALRVAGEGGVNDHAKVLVAVPPDPAEVEDAPGGVLIGGTPGQGDAAPPAPPDPQDTGGAEGDPGEPAGENTDVEGESDLWAVLLREAGEEDAVDAAADATAGHIAAWHLRAGDLAHKAVVHGCMIGLALIEQKKRLRHGKFKPWISDNCTFSYSTANRYMRAARWASEKSHACDFSRSDLSLRKVDRLLPSPKSAEGKSTRKKASDSSGPSTPTAVVEQNNTPTSTSPRANHREVGETPSPANDTVAGTISTVEEVKDNIKAALANVDGGGGLSHGTSENASPAAVDTDGNSDQTTSSNERALAGESTVAGPECPESPGVEVALAALLKALQASTDMRAQAVTSIARIADLAGLKPPRQDQRPALRPASVSKVVPTARAPRRRVLRYADAMSKPCSDVTETAEP